MTVREVAAELRVCRATVYRFIESGRLRSARMGGSIYRVRRSDLRAFVDGHGAR
jgi:excisionase family DNA binding protein